jgi:hypothetical protein
MPYTTFDYRRILLTTFGMDSYELDERIAIMTIDGELSEIDAIKSIYETKKQNFKKKLSL